MGEENRGRKERPSRYIEDPRHDEPAGSSSRVAFRQHRKTSTNLPQFPDQYVAPHWEYALPPQQWQGAHVQPHGGPRNWFIPHAPPYPINSGHIATQSTGRLFPGQRPFGYPQAQNIPARAPAQFDQAYFHPPAPLPPAQVAEADELGPYNTGTYQSASTIQHQNPFMPRGRAYAPTGPRDDFRSDDFAAPAENSQRPPDRLHRWLTDVSQRLPTSHFSDRTSQCSVPEPPPSDVYEPPQMTNDKVVGRYQQAFVGSSDLTPTGIPHKREATQQDADSHNIPPGYNLKHWDPNEKPIILLGTVFDYNSLGKWIFDFTVDSHGSQTAFSGMAGDLWLVLIEFYGSTKITEEYIDDHRSSRNPKLHEARAMLEDFLQEGKFLRARLHRLLEKCGEPMLDTDVQNTGHLRRRAGEAFVKTLFGEDQFLEETDELKQRIRHWVHCWKDKCADIVKSRRGRNV